MTQGPPKGHRTGSTKRFLKKAPFDDRRRRGLLSPEGRPVCRWCGNSCPKPARAWCGPACKDHFMIRHSGTWARRRVEQRDQGVCTVCKVDTRALQGRIEAINRRGIQIGRHRDIVKIRIDRVLRRAGWDPGQAFWDMDHIIPVKDGGGQCGLENLRTLCVRCHKTDTRKWQADRQGVEYVEKERSGSVWTDLPERTTLTPMDGTITTLRMRVSDLADAGYNDDLRTITPAELNQLEQSIEEFGFLELIVWNRRTGHIVHGHQKHKILSRRGVEYTDVIPVDVSEEREKSINVALNHLGGRFNPEGLARLLDEIGEAERALTGFQEDEFNDLMAQLEAQAAEPAEGHTDPNALPQLPDEARTQPGDLWILGDHRLLCGDCTDPDQVKRVLAGERPAIMVTDPPYGIELDHGKRDHGDGRGTGRSRRAGQIKGDTRSSWAEVYPLVGAPILYIWHNPFDWNVQLGLEAAGWNIRQQIIWHKTHLVFGRAHYHWKHDLCWYAVHRDHIPPDLPTSDDQGPAMDPELIRWAARHDLHYHETHQPCWYAIKKGATAAWKGDRKQTTVWEETSPITTANSDEISTLHPTQKPIRLYEQPYSNHTHKGDLVFDAFMGSGTALIAAQRLGRRCYGIEIDPRFVDMAVLRWEQFTGQEARKDITDGHQEGPATPAKKGRRRKKATSSKTRRKTGKKASPASRKKKGRRKA